MLDAGCWMLGRSPSIQHLNFTLIKTEGKQDSQEKFKDDIKTRAATLRGCKRCESPDVQYCGLTCCREKLKPLRDCSLSLFQSSMPCRRRSIQMSRRMPEIIQNAFAHTLLQFALQQPPNAAPIHHRSETSLNLSAQKVFSFQFYRFASYSITKI